MILLKQISHYYREAEPFVKVSDADIEKIDNSVLVRAILSKYREDQAREPAGSPGSIGGDRKSTRLNSSHVSESRMPSSA